MTAKILITAADPVERHHLERLCRGFGYEAQSVAHGPTALARLSASSAAGGALLILDLVMPDFDGMAAISRLRAARSRLPIIVSTTQGRTDSALAAVRAGAQDFVVKPAEPARLQVAIKNALHAARLSEEARFFDLRLIGRLGFGDLISESAAMMRAVRLGEKGAKSTLPILLEGEAGTGKESFARALHGASQRRCRPFVAVKCATLSAAQAVSLLFGEARKRIPGRLKEAEGGTLFLDRICALPMEAQIRLLDVLQQDSVVPAGSKRPLKADIRLIAAADEDLIEQVSRGFFRQDLFYRLNVFPITLPPLRARAADIGPLAERFCARHAAEQGKRIFGICAEALALLTSHDWPGNLRQLETAVFRAVLLAEGSELTVADFSLIAARAGGASGLRVMPADRDLCPQLPRQKEFVPIKMRDPNVLPLLNARGQLRSLAELEAATIRFALDRYRGQMSVAARELGIGRSTLYRKVKDCHSEAALNPAAEAAEDEDKGHGLARA
ncbi:MAG TPA: sigma-54 dependent transcriptional regulator [Methylocella sp.]|nr:sigma-54 dependent transcriptional regulator [Methylocella sp.]